jgi:predicted Zn-dependent protease
MPEPLTRAQCEKIFEQVADAARKAGVKDVEAMIGAGASALTRFANNTIHQNVAERTAFLSVRALIDGRTARASTNAMDAESIRAVVEQAIAITKLQEPDPEMLPLAEPDAVTETPRTFERTAQTTPQERAEAVAEAIAVIEAAGQTAAGIYSTGGSVLAMLNSRGVSTYHAETMAQFSVTAMAHDSSGWAKASTCNAADLKPVKLASIAADKALVSAAPVVWEPGKYTVILEPAAVLDLVGQMFMDFSATALKDGRSFLMDRIGQALFGKNVTIHDDAYHPLQAGPAFDGEGMPRRKLALVEDGVVREVAYSRQAAALDGKQPTGHGFPLPNEMGEAPLNVVIAGGEATIDDMIASTERGILVTRLWYIREVDPYEKIMTGMTRDGTFRIENGQVTGGLRNFRFNQGLVELLQNVETLGPAVRASGEETFDAVVPAMKVRDFNFTEVTKF